MAGRGSGDVTERVRILEKALADVGDRFAKQMHESSIERDDIQRQLKAIKLFLGRNLPEFKKEFPEIQRKLR